MTAGPVLRYVPLFLLALCWEAASRLHIASSLALPPLTSVPRRGSS